MAIAPTASISIIAGGTSACIEPIPANIYTHKTLSGSFSIKNPYLEKLLGREVKDSPTVWNSILEQGGSVQHLDFLTPEEKDVFKTSFEIDQRWLLELAADRTPFIDQAQCLNLFIPADVDKWDLMMLHFRAWELGIKSLYYLRSKSVQRAGFAGGVEADNTPDLKRNPARLDHRLRRVPGVPVKRALVVLTTCRAGAHRRRRACSAVVGAIDADRARRPPGPRGSRAGRVAAGIGGDHADAASAHARYRPLARRSPLILAASASIWLYRRRAPSDRRRLRQPGRGAAAASSALIMAIHALGLHRLSPEPRRSSRHGCRP